MSHADNEIKAFDARYSTEEREIIIVTNQMSGSSKSGGETLWTGNQGFIAYYDITEKKVHEIKDRVQWLVLPDLEDRFKFEKEHIYHIKVRPALPPQLKDYQEPIDLGLIEQLPDLTHHFMLVDIISHHATHEALQTILTKYKKPVVITTEFGEFTLDKYLHCFNGQVRFLDKQIPVSVDVDDEGSQTADLGLKNLHTFHKNQHLWDTKIKTFTATQLTELANDWQQQDDDKQDNPPISEDDFRQRISISELAFYPDNSFEAFYDDGDLFWGHIIIVSGHMDGTLHDACIAG